MMRIATRLFCLLLMMAAANVADAQFFIHKLERGKLIYSSPLQSYLVPHLSRSFETALQTHRSILGFDPYDDITVLVGDLQDQGNAGATAVPRNFVRVMLSPLKYTYETIVSGERVSFIMNHELVHVAASDMPSRKDRVFRNLFGGKVGPDTDHPVSLLYSYLTAPRAFSPRWYHEGAAVFMETWMGGGLGRALGAYDEMVFRTLVRDNERIYHYVGLESEGTAIDFQVGVNSYLYGTRFMSYLATLHGPEKIAEWIARKPGTADYFSVRFRQVFGKSLRSSWSEWIDAEREFQMQNLARVRENPVTESLDLTSRPLGSVSRGFYDHATGTLYAGVRYPGQVAHLAAIDVRTGAIRKIKDVRGPALFYVTSLTFDTDARKLFYTADNLEFRDLHVVDVDSGRDSLLVKDARVGDLAFNRVDKSIWGVRHFNGISTIVRIPPPYSEWNQVHSLPYGIDLYDIDISNDGRMLSGALVERSGSQKLIGIALDSLSRDSFDYTQLFDFGTSNPETFVFSPDDGFLYGSSYVTGVSNIFRYNLDSLRMEVVSNAETGYFRPIPLDDDSLFVFRYSAEGFVPALIPDRPVSRVSAIRFLGQEVVEKYPVVKEWVARPRVTIPTAPEEPTAYQPLRHMALKSVYPMVQGYKDYVAAGLHFDIADPIGLHAVTVDVSYTPTESLPADERFHASLKYRFSRWRFGASYNNANFYDLLGPTRVGRKGYAGTVGYRRSLVFDGPRKLNLDLGLAGYAGLDRLPDAQNVSASFGELLSANIGLHYENLRSSLGKVDDEKGFTWGASLTTNYVNRNFFPLAHAEFDYGIALPLNHSSIWLRTSAGVSTDRPDEPFSNFYFGGFGNNGIDHRSVKRYREFYSFPGLEINQAGGTNYARAMLEWTLPPLRFRTIGTSFVYLRWARPAVFGSFLRTNFFGDGDPSEYVNAGGQLDFRLVMLTYIPATFSIGYAVAQEIDGDLGKEFMISLKVMGGE